MKSYPTEIKQFYDIGNHEKEIIDDLYNIILLEAKRHGFLQIETSMVEEKKKYLAATKVDSSKIFDVKRTKESTSYALKADIAMSISRFVANLPQQEKLLKFIEISNIFRDRVSNIPGYRRQFKQILIGEWGSNSPYTDAEIIFLAYNALKKFENENFKVSFLEISNLNIFDSIQKGLSKKIRDNGIIEIESILNLDKNDKMVIKELFKDDRISYQNLEKNLKKIHNNNIIIEINKMTEIRKNIINFFEIKEENIFFSLHNVQGTGHYSGLHYRIYCKFKDQDKEIEHLIVDGGRIDNLSNKFNPQRNIPGTCLGIGVSILSQFFKKKRNNKKIALLINQDKIEQNYKKIQKIKEKFSEYAISLIPDGIKNKKKLLKSQFYYDYNFILFHENEIEVRSNDLKLKNEIIIKMKEIIS